MTTAELITAPQASVAVLMGVDEAREYVQHLRHDLATVDDRLASFRARALDFAEREGWRALGYNGFLEAINSELGTQYSRSYLSRLIGAAKVERLLELPMGNDALPERVLREIGRAETPEQQRAAYQAATEAAGDKPPTVGQARAAVEQTRPQARGYTTDQTDPARLDHHLPPPVEWRAAQQRAGAIGLRLEMDARGKFSLLNDRGSGVMHVADFESILRHLENYERAHAENEKARADYPDMAVFRAVLDRAESLGAIYDPMSQRADGRMPVLAPPGFGSQPPQPAYYDAAELQTACDSWEAWQWTWAKEKAEATADQPPAIDADDARRRNRAAELVRELARLLREIETNDLAALSQAITDLAEAPERGEAPYLINVLWAYLDLELDEVGT
jgi:hypothetical protein